jgi:general secretion pathway protein I
MHVIQAAMGAARRQAGCRLRAAAVAGSARKPHAAAAAGFTLLEVLAAFIIAALGSILLYQAAFEGAANATAAARYQEAVVRAQSRLASIGVLTSLQPETLSGDDGGGFTWRLIITPKAGNGTVTLFDVQMTERFGNRQVALDTQRLAPAS